MKTDVLEGGNALTLLMLPTDDGVYLFPALQFRDGNFFDRLDEMFITFQTLTDDPWIWAYWMTPAIPESSLPGEVERIVEKIRDVSLHGSAQNWWWIAHPETTGAEGQDG